MSTGGGGAVKASSASRQQVGGRFFCRKEVESMEAFQPRALLSAKARLLISAFAYFSTV